MSIQARLATILAALALFGCKGPVSTSAASIGEGGDGASAGTISTASSSGGARVESIADPTLNNMTAFAVTLPAKWHFQGTLFQGDSCQTIPMPVFRASSPDGHSFGEQMPGLAWRWGSGPLAANAPKNDCLPMHGPMSAQDLAKYLAGTMHVEYVGPDAVPEQVNAKAQQAAENAKAAYAGQYAARNQQPPKSSRELARAIVKYQVGSTPMKGRLHVMVDCMESSFAGPPRLGAYGGPGRPPQMVRGQGSTVDKCGAMITYFTAPESQFAELVRQWDVGQMGARAQNDWTQAWIDRNAREGQRWIDDMWARSRATMQAQQDRFNHDQAVRQEMHNQFMQTMQEGTDRSMARTQDAMNARSTSTSDWVDYALDRQTVVNTNNGLTYKIPNQVTVEQPLQKVHGDGTPY